MADTTVKFFHSGMLGAPAISGGVGASAGVLAALLDSLLVNGFGLTSVSSLSISSNVATVVTTTPHSLEIGSVAKVAGVTGGAAAVNGEQKVLTRTTYSYTFATSGISNQTASGSITSKNASLGWTTEFSDTNLRAYRPAAGSRFYLRLDDTDNTFADRARARGYESMSDINSGTNPFPTSVQGVDTGGQRWSKLDNWVLIGDLQGFYLATNRTGSSGFMTLYWGDLQPEGSADAYAVFSGGWQSDASSTGSPSSGDLTAVSSYQNLFGFIARSSTGLGGSQIAYYVGWPWPTYPLYFSGGVQLPISHPDPANNSLRLAQLKCLANSSVRATFPGIYPSYQAIGATYGHLDQVDGQGVLANRKLVAVRTGSASGTSYGAGAIFFDITGPWAR